MIATGRAEVAAAPAPVPAPRQSVAVPSPGGPPLADRAGRTAAARPSYPVGGPWVAQGPGPILHGQVENVAPLDEAVGAVQALACDPVDPNVLYVGAVNGGIWKTTNARASEPTWTPLTDDHPSLSIGALEFDPIDSTHQTLLAGIGHFSSFGGFGDMLAGLLYTTDGGASWADIDGGGALRNANIAGVAARGSTFVLAIDEASPNHCDLIGVYRTTDRGATFAQVTTGLPAGRAMDLAGDPIDSATLYTSIVFADVCAHTANGIFKSTDAGATWVRGSDAAIEAALTNDTARVKISVGRHNDVYVGIVKDGLTNLFRSGDAGGTWTAMDLPTTVESGIPVGVGGNRDMFSIRADPENANLVYVGGTAQPEPFPNSIGARDFDGRLFRGDAARPSGSQWVHLTHSNVLGAMGGGTAHGSAPHADSRGIAFDAGGDLVEVDDGGVYRRTLPRANAGDWVSVNGTLQVTELHDVAYDHVAHVIVGGAQDTGTVEQQVSGNPRWNTFSGGDGGDVLVDTTSLPGESIRYSSVYGLQDFRRSTYDASNMLLAETFPALEVIGGGAPFQGSFVTPIALDTVEPARLVIVGSDSIYESFDRGDTLLEIGPGLGTGQHAVVYGGSRDGLKNPDVLYVGRQSTVYARLTAGGALIPTTYAGGEVRGVVMEPQDWMTAFAIDPAHVYETTDAGSTWTDVSGNLPALGVANFRTLAYLGSPVDALTLGTEQGVFVTFAGQLGRWLQLGTGLPGAIVNDLAYDQVDDVLVAGTMGRGAWMLGGVSDIVCTDGTPLDCDDGNPCSVDICDPVAGCQHTPAADGISCSDEDVCNGTETCQLGACVKGAPLDCDDGIACTMDSCAPATGCTYSTSPGPLGAPCIWTLARHTAACVAVPVPARTDRHVMKAAGLIEKALSTGRPRRAHHLFRSAKHELERVRRMLNAVRSKRHIGAECRASLLQALTEAVARLP